MIQNILHTTRRSAFAFLYLLVVALPLTLTITTPASAIECDGTLTAEDCPHVTIGTPLTGNYRTATAAIGMYPQESTETISLNIPNCTVGSPTIIQSTLYWAMRDFDDNTYWDQSVDITRDGGAPTTVNSDRRYKSQPDAGASSSYVADITADGIVTAGLHTYDISNFTISPGAVNPNTSQWGFGIHAIYECPEFAVRTIVQKEGHDVHWRGWPDAWSQDRSELVCESFTASASSRSATLEFFAPGSVDPATRQADIWYKTGTGAEPAPDAYDLLTDVNTPANGGAILTREIFSGEPELEIYTSPTITIPAGAEYLCMQSDSSFNFGEHPDNALVSGASMVLGAGWFIYDDAAPVPGTVSLGNMVWNDLNNNGILDGTETGICNVTVQLFTDTNNDNAYTTAADGTTPDATQTTGCGGTAGQYLFAGLTAGNYCIVIPQSQFNTGNALFDYVSSSGNNGSATGTYEPSTNDPDNNTNDDDNGTTVASVGVVSCAVALATGTEPINDGDTDADTNLTVDFGFFRDACLGDFVWLDTNNNGIQDSGEAGVANVTATLFLASGGGGPGLATQTTNSNGGYMFCYLIPGAYYVEFTNLPSGHTLVKNDGTNDGALNSDANPTTARTPTYTLAAGDNNTTVDGDLFAVAAATTLANTGLSANYLMAIGLGILALPALYANKTVRKYRRTINRY